MPPELTSAIMQIGFPGIMCYLLWKQMNKKDQDTREYFKEEIKILRNENKEEKEMFRSSVESFNDAVSEFKAVKSDIENVDRKVESIINIIKEK